MNTLVVVVTQQAADWEIEIPAKGTRKIETVKQILTKIQETQTTNHRITVLQVVPQASLINKMCHRVNVIRNSSTDKAYNNSSRSHKHRHWWWAFKTSRPTTQEMYQTLAVLTSTQHPNSTGWVRLITMRPQMAPRVPCSGHPFKTAAALTLTSLLDAPLPDQDVQLVVPAQIETQTQSARAMIQETRSRAVSRVYKRSIFEVQGRMVRYLSRICRCGVANYIINSTKKCLDRKSCHSGAY